MHGATLFKEDLENKLLNTAQTIDGFEGYRNPHAIRIAILADATARVFNLAERDRYILRQAALVHDIGELVMNREYINAARILTADELDDMRRHTVIGEQEAAHRGFSKAVQLLVRWHHEWWNGAGYPDALSREQIPLMARILRVADTYAALTDRRSYREAISAENARRYLTEWSGIEFDPSVVKAFLSLENLPELESYYQNKEAENIPAAEITEDLPVPIGAGTGEISTVSDETETSENSSLQIENSDLETENPNPRVAEESSEADLTEPEALNNSDEEEPSDSENFNQEILPSDESSRDDTPYER